MCSMVCLTCIGVTAHTDTRKTYHCVFRWFVSFKYITMHGTKKHKIRQYRSTYMLSPPKVLRLLRWLLFVLFLFVTYLSVSGRCSQWMLGQLQQWTLAEIEAENH